MSMKAALGILALLFATSALAQSAPPKVSKKPSAQAKPAAQAKPKVPMGCKPVGTVKGTKIWAGDCLAATPAAETGPPSSPPAQPSSAIPPGEKTVIAHVGPSAGWWSWGWKAKK